MLIDWSATAAWIALIVAIVSPVVTTILNHRFQLKLKDREIMSQRKLQTIDGYLKAASYAAYTLGVPDDFAQYRAVIFLHAPKEIHDNIRKLNKAIEETRFSEETSNLLYDVSEALRAENKIS